MRRKGKECGWEEGERSSGRKAFRGDMCNRRRIASGSFELMCVNVRARDSGILRMGGEWCLCSVLGLSRVSEFLMAFSY